MKMMLCHLTGSLRGRTQYFDTDSISFGIGGQCGIVFDETKDSMVCPVHAELAVEEGQPILRDRSGQDALVVNGLRSTEAALKDGDLIQFGDGGPLVRFRLLSDEAPECKPWQHIVEDSRGHFAPGSMGPKIEAAISFLEQGGKEVIITGPEKALAALAGQAGTHIYPHVRPDRVRQAR